MKKNNYYLITGGIGLIGSNIVKKIFTKIKINSCFVTSTVYIDPIKAAYGDFRKNRFNNIINEKEYVKSRTKRIIVEGKCS